MDPSLSSFKTSQTSEQMKAEIKQYVDDQQKRDAGEGSMWTKSRLIVIKKGDFSEIKCTNSLIDRFWAFCRLSGYSDNIGAFKEGISDSGVKDEITQIISYKTRLDRIKLIPDSSFKIDNKDYI